MFNELPPEAPIVFRPELAPDGSPQLVDAQFVKEKFDSLTNQQIAAMARGDTGLFYHNSKEEMLYLDVRETRERDPETFAKLKRNEIDVTTELHRASLAKQSQEAQLENAVGLRTQAKDAEIHVFERPLRVAQILSSNSTEIYPREQTAPMTGQVSAVTPTRVSFVSDEDNRERHILRTHCEREDGLRPGDKIKFNFNNGKATPTVTERYVSPAEKRLLDTVAEPGVMHINRTPRAPVATRGARAG